MEVDQDYRNYKQSKESNIDKVLGQHPKQQEVQGPIPITTI